MKVNFGILFSFYFVIFEITNSLPLNGNENDSTAQQNNENILLEPPLIFPENSSQYKVVTNNETALKILLHLADPTTDSEITALNKAPEDSARDKSTAYEQSVNASSTQTKSPLDLNRSFQYSDEDDDDDEDVADDDDEDDNEDDELKAVKNDDETVDDIKLDVETVQDSEKESADELEENFGKDNGEQKMKDIFKNISAEVSGIETHHVVGIFVVLFVISSIIIYFALISYRNKLEKKYGMRELLVTEDDFYSNNDTRHIDL